MLEQDCPDRTLKIRHGIIGSERDVMWDLSSSAMSSAARAAARRCASACADTPRGPCASTFLHITHFKYSMYQILCMYVHTHTHTHNTHKRTHTILQTDTHTHAHTHKQAHNTDNEHTHTHRGDRVSSAGECHLMTDSSSIRTASCLLVEGVPGARRNVRIWPWRSILASVSMCFPCLYLII